MKKCLIYFSLLFVFLILLSGCGDNKEKKNKDIKYTNDFNIDLIKSLTVEKNYLISPYSIEVALNMLKEGADGNTLKEIEKILSDRKINDISIKDRINIANAIFIKDTYKNKIKKDYTNLLNTKYDSEILYDKFKTPDVINNWVEDKTDGMIKKVVDQVDEDFALGLANAIAIDVEWASEFDCSQTIKDVFTKVNGKKINVEMMNATFSSNKYKYLETDDAKGIIIPYKSYDPSTGKVNYDSDNNLEFIAILPNSSVEEYINNLTSDKLDELLSSSKSASSKYEIKLLLPRFKYSYDAENFKEALISMGIKDAFSFNDANFTNIMDKNDMKGNLYVGTAVHKTYIDVNEKGTRAAAVTFFGLKDSAAILEEDKDVVEIKFDKPFIYMIRDSKTKEMLFFGAVYEPTEWSGSTCK